MVKFVHIKILIVFSSFPFILADTKQNTSTAADIDHGFTDGQQFVKKIVLGDKVSYRPEYLIFTAPYKLCEGGCKNDSSNFVMAFPLYIGKKGRQTYRGIYHRDLAKIHSMRPNAPFKRKTSRRPYTVCATEKANNDLTTSVTESHIKSEEYLTTNTRCPNVVPRNCRKKTTSITPALRKEEDNYNFLFDN